MVAGEGVFGIPPPAWSKVCIEIVLVLSFPWSRLSFAGFSGFGFESLFSDGAKEGSNGAERIGATYEMTKIKNKKAIISTNGMRLKEKERLERDSERKLRA